MKLEQLYLDFMQLDDAGQLSFICEYRNKRMIDLSNIKTKERSANMSKFDISEEEKVMIKLLGLKMKDIVALRAIEPLEEGDDQADLFDDTGLVEGDEL